MRILKSTAQPTNAFFATVNQMFDGSFQLPSDCRVTAEQYFVVRTVLNDLITASSAVVRSWEEPLSIWLMAAKNAFVDWALNFGVRTLLKSAVSLSFQTIFQTLSLRTDRPARRTM